MKLRIQYATEYRYSEAVSFSPHIFRLLPKADLHLKVERFDFKTNEHADVQQRRDLFDNIVAQCFYPGTAPALWARLEMELQLEEKNPFHFLLAPYAAELPFTYQAREAAVLAPYLRHQSHPVELPFWKPERGATVARLLELNAALQEHIRYERREEGAAWTPAETLAAGYGACRDFAVLLAETLRGTGIAARLASGYLCETGNARKTAEGALHAWTEAYLPGAGWVGIDPANGIFCNHLHITAATGLTPEDIAPISGRYFSDRQVGSSMSTSLQLEAGE
jgi:transglutaminase-like putative cysteine protease